MIGIRTDLALEARELYKDKEIPGVSIKEEREEGIKVTRVKILDERGERAMGKPVGDYITIEAPGLLERDLDLEERVAKVLASILSELAQLKKESHVLVVGLGNWNVTPDALGPRVVSNIVVTRHLKEYAPLQFGDEIRSVSAFSPGVLGITGIETAEILKGVVDRVRPDLVITIDALASRRLERLSTTIQISNTGISPGSGIRNRRLSITYESLGVPVIAIGVPTVVDAVTIAHDTIDYLVKELSKETSKESVFYKILENMKEQEKYTLIEEVLSPHVQNLVVTPKEIDLLIKNIASVISRGINLALQPGLTEKEMNQLLH
ncbi:GPR endopeptidase [Caldanaerobacter sp.]|uniref:GPR endopeptidase n=1 Tax=Caldanaerobacter sp. TaxID=2930036 RepID=UPI003C753EC3